MNYKSIPSYSKAHPGANVLVIDTETSGTVFGAYEDTFSKYQVLSIALIIADSTTFEEKSSLYLELKFDADKYEWTAEAEKVHGLTREHLEANGLTAEEAAVEIGNFIIDTFGTGKVCFLGHNVHFDIEALRQVLEPFGIMPDIHHVVLDTSPAAFIAIGKYRSDDVFNFFSGAERNSHNALDDARFALDVARGIRTIVSSVLETA